LAVPPDLPAWKRPRLKRTTEFLHAPNGDLYLRRPSEESDIRIREPTREMRHLLESLDGTRTHAELEEDFDRCLVEDLVLQLSEMGLGEDAADDELVDPQTRERFDRQLRYFSDVGLGTTPSTCQERLGDSRVAVLGVGGLGGWTALALACHGIGEMLLVDFDVVDLSNLNRQVLFSASDVGGPKAELAARRLLAFNPAAHVACLEERLDSEATVGEVIAGYDLVINAVDWPAHDIEVWVNSACFSAGIPYVAMSHYPPIARVGPFYVPGKTGCYSCQEIAYKRDYPLYEAVVAQQRAKPSPAATLGGACAFIAGQASLDVMHYITGLAQPSTFGESHIYDLKTMEVRKESVVPEPECPVCGLEEENGASPRH